MLNKLIPLVSAGIFIPLLPTLVAEIWKAEGTPYTEACQMADLVTMPPGTDLVFYNGQTPKVSVLTQGQNTAANIFIAWAVWDHPEDGYTVNWTGQQFKVEKENGSGVTNLACPDGIITSGMATAIRAGTSSSISILDRYIAD